MDKLPLLQKVLGNFAGLTDDDLSVSLPFWRERTIVKHDFYNKQNVVCRDLGIVVKGIFRVFYYDEASDEEKNMYFFSEDQFVVSFRSFLYQYPCVYYIEALEESKILYIPYSDLQQLYDTHKCWEKFGRLLAEHFFHQSQGRTEELLFLTHENRYLNLVKQHPTIVNRVHSYHIASFLGIKKQSLSRIRKRVSDRK